MYTGILTKVKSTHSNLRTPTVNGWFEELPKEGLGFVIASEPLESGNVRIVSTSEVKNIKLIKEDILEFETLNSCYNLQFKKTDEESPFNL